MSTINQITVGSTTYDIEDMNAVPSSRTVNGLALSSNITLEGDKIRTTIWDSDPNVDQPFYIDDELRDINNLINTLVSQQVPNSRTINGYALSSNITLTASDVSAISIPESTIATQNDVSVPVKYNDVMKWETASCSPGNGKLAKYDYSGYLISTTPSASDNSTKVATTSYVQGALTNRTLYYSSVACSVGSGDIATVSNSAITANHVVAEISFATSSYITTDVTWTTSSGSLVLSGTCTNATTANILLVLKDN